MNWRLKLASNITTATEVWFFTSELEGQRAGSFRQERWCELFVEAGRSITVFNITGAVGLTIRTFTSRQSFTEFRRAKVAEAKLRASVRQGRVARLMRRLKHLTLADLYLPNVLLLACRATLRTATLRGRVVIMASSPPFSTALAASLVKAFLPGKVVLAIDMRDAWALHRALGGIRLLKRSIERTVLQSADYLSTVSYGLQTEFENTYAVRTQVLYNVASHYFQKRPAMAVDWRRLNSRINDGRFKIVYTGSTPEGFYDVATLVKAIGHLRVAEPNIADKYQFIFVGACSEVQTEVEKCPAIADDIVFVQQVTHEMARAIQQRADALLFLGYYGVGVVSTKIFEYLALSKPILPLFVTKGSDVAELLKAFGGAECYLFDKNDIVEILRKLNACGSDGILPRLVDPKAIQVLLNDYKAYVTELLSN